MNAPTTFTSPVLDQNLTPDCAIFCNAATVAAITGKIYPTNDILTDVLDYLGQTEQDYQGCDLGTAMNVAVNPGFFATDGTKFNYDAVLYIFQEGDSFCDTINSYIQQYQRPANLAGVWFNEQFNTTANGVVPPNGTTLLGGHDMMLCGIGSDGMMLNQSSWGVGAPGSLNGFYKFSPQTFDSYYKGYKCGIGINSDNQMVKLLGKLNALYVQLADRL